MSAPEPVIDLELIAAYIDGRVTPAERERALRLFAHSDAAFEVLVDVLRVQAEHSDSNVVPIGHARSRRRLGRWSVLIPAAAAATLLIAVLPRLRASHGEQAAFTAASVIGAVTRGSDLRSIAAGNRWEQRDWSVTRGGTSALADSARAFRLGVRTVDLQVALGVDDRLGAGRTVAEMVDYISPLPFSEVVTSQYTNLRQELTGPQPRERIAVDASQAEAKLGELFGSRPSDSFWFGLGKWCAGADLAASARSSAFFQSDLSARLMRDALERGAGTLTQDDVATLRQAATLTRPDVTRHEFDLVRDAMRAMIKRHAS